MVSSLSPASCSEITSVQKRIPHENMAVMTLLESNGYRMVERLGNNNLMVNSEFGKIYTVVDHAVGSTSPAESTTVAAVPAAASLQPPFVSRDVGLPQSVWALKLGETWRNDALFCS